MTTISASPTTLVANGVATSTITVQAKDTYGNDLSGSGGAVTLHPTVGTIGTITDNGNGTYTATFTSATATGDSFITGTIGGNTITGSASVSLTPGTVSTARTAISTSPTTLVANGSTQSTVTVQAKDANGNDLTTSGGAVTLHPTLGTIGTVINNNDGTYTATFTSSTTAGMSTITGTIGGTAMTASTAIMLTSSPTPPAAPAGATSSASGTSDTSGGTATTINSGTTASGTGVGALTVAQYGSDPVGPPTFTSTGKYFDVALSTGNSFSHVTVTDCDLGGGNGLEWFNGAANSGGGAWQAVRPAASMTRAHRRAHL